MKSILIILTILISIWSADAAETIKVLIVNDVYSKIPEKGEKIKRLGSIEGNLLVTGTHYSGNIEVWRGNSGLYLINELPLEDYVRGVVIAEVGFNWEMEALKAQAVLSRTYALYQKKINGDSIYHLTSSVLHQVYKGSSSDIRVAYAVTGTRSEILTFNGSTIEPFYHSTCGGKTEIPEEVFGKNYPYLRSVESNCETSPYWVWERKIPLKEIENALALSGIKKITIQSYTSTNRTKELNIIHKSGTITVRATDFRRALGWSTLPSTNFTISKDGDLILFNGKGYGHGVGLCQWSALQMASEGKNYKDILSFFYPGTTLQLYEGR